MIVQQPLFSSGVSLVLASLVGAAVYVMANGVYPWIVCPAWVLLALVVGSIIDHRAERKRKG